MNCPENLKEKSALWLNPKTGKGWTDDEESAFAEILTAGNLPRIKAIHLWKRCRKDSKNAVRLAESTQKLRAAADNARAKSQTV
jgi:hypothetical protein